MKKFEAEVFVDKSKLAKIYIVGGVLLLIAIGCVLWASIYWDDYSETVQTLGGRVKTRGLAPTLYGWGLGFAIVIPIVYGLMFFSTDFKNPSLGVNEDGLFLNQQLFKKAFITWDEMAAVQDIGRGMEIIFKNPQALVNKQKGFRKVLLKQTYVKDGSPLSLDDSAFKGEFEKMEALIKEYFNKHHN